MVETDHVKRKVGKVGPIKASESGAGEYIYLPRIIITHDGGQGSFAIIDWWVKVMLDMGLGPHANLFS